MSKSVLIVEDEPNIVVPLQFSLEQKGYRVFVAESGEDAMDRIAEQKPDLILLDIMLPGIDGFEVCQSVRQNAETRNTKIIFLSAMGRDIDVAKGMALDADAYIIKPFSILEVMEKVDSLVTGPRKP
jgi:two-component system alkaline phosphatase synthesis response regulator PhoP